MAEFEYERDLLVSILKELNKMGINPEAIERKLYPHLTAASVRNYLNGKTKPKKSKFTIILTFLKSEFPQEYGIVKQRVLEKNGVSSVKDYIIKRMKEEDNIRTGDI